MNWKSGYTYFGFLIGRFSLFIILTLVSLLSSLAFAEDATTIHPVTGKHFATVWRIHGEVTASDSDNTHKRILHIGDGIYVGEHVYAAALAEAVLKTDDAGIVAIRPMTEFIAEKFVAEGKPTDSFVLRIVTGSLRVISGWIAHTNRAGHHIATPSATIGIRGTDHEPFVLSEELATATGNREGTYDKVNRGGTTMQVGEQKLDIDPGKVGFVRAPGKPIKQRGMMTLLLPVLLDKVPNFYVPGKFDAELDTYSLNADKESLRQLKLKRKSEITSSIKECAPAKIANTWLAQLDKAIIRHDAPAIIDMFSPDVSIQATVHGNDGNMVSIDLERDEFVKSTIEAMKGLTEYKQRRMWTEAKQEASSSENACDRIKVKTLVSEQGRQSGKPYRFKSLEEHTLELREGKWLSINTRTTQQ